MKYHVRAYPRVIVLVDGVVGRAFLLRPRFAMGSLVAMRVDDFLGLVRIIANHVLVRHYLSTYPGKMVIEIANLGGENLDALRQDLAGRGFQEMPQTDFCCGVTLLRFAIDRVSDGRQ